MKVKQKIESEGFRRKEGHNCLDNLAVAYACCEWIRDQEPYAGVPRWQRKNQIFERLVEDCKREPPNKGELASRSLVALSDPKLDYLASKILLFAAVEARPEKSDIDLIVKVSLDSLPDGNARIRALYAARAVSDRFQISKAEVQKLTGWLDFTKTTEHYVRDAQKLLRESLARHAK